MNMNELLLYAITWIKLTNTTLSQESRYTKVHTTGLHPHKIQKQVKLIHADKRQDSGRDSSLRMRRVVTGGAGAPESAGSVLFLDRSQVYLK